MTFIHIKVNEYTEHFVNFNQIINVVFETHRDVSELTIFLVSGDYLTYKGDKAVEFYNLFLSKSEHQINVNK